ncbi:MAG: YbhB/YbcL family Raf kinase inhibitor-like protein, partial [Pseudomonadota bacterium]
VSPELSWVDAPEGSKAFAILCHDPDAPLVSADGNYGFVHWVYYNIPASVTSLPEGDSNYTNGINNFGDQKYGGPMPPNGHGQHHYYFWILALDTDEEIEAGLSLYDFLAKVEPNILGMNRLIGTYIRD